MPYLLGYIGAVVALTAAVLGFFALAGEVRRARRAARIGALAGIVAGLALIAGGVLVDHVQHQEALAAHLWDKYDVRPVGAAHLGEPVTLRGGDGKILSCALSGSWEDPVATCGGAELDLVWRPSY